MTTAAQRPHLYPVPDQPTVDLTKTTEPVEGVVVPVGQPPLWARSQAALIRQARDFRDGYGYLPQAGRGYQNLGARWLAGYRDNWPHMIETVDAAIAASRDITEQSKLRDELNKRRADYWRHRLIYSGVTAGIGTVGIAGATVGALTGGLWFDLPLLVAGWWYGARRGRADSPALQLHAATEATQLKAPTAGVTPQGVTADQLPADTKPFPVRQAQTPEQLAICVLAAMRKDGVPIAEVFDISRHVWGWQCTVRVSEGTPEAIIKAAGDLETSFDLGTNRLRIQPLKERRACATLRLIESDPFATAPPPPYRAPKSISITDRSRLGTSIGGDPLEISLAGVMGLIVAASGGGKTGILQSLGEVTTACYDNITIDLDPFGDGLEDLHDAARITARTTEQIEAVLAFLLVLAKGRARLRRKLGMGNKWRPSAEHPAVTVFFDEFPKASELAQLLAVELLLVGRKECVDLELASQGGTSRYLSENIAQMIAFRAVGPCKRVDTNAVFGDGAAAEGWLPHRLDPATDTDPKDAGHVFVQGVPGLADQPVEYAIHHHDAAALRKLAAERFEAGLVDLDQESIDAMGEVDLPEISGFPKLLSWPALLRLCGAQPPVGHASSHPIVAEALAVMDERHVDRMRTETLAAALHMTAADLKAKLRAAGVPDPAPIGEIDGLQNPRGYKRDTLARA
jgi:S-DNA-T family DNA segregation ATPase FtsK/SpoIIIE